MNGATNATAPIQKGYFIKLTNTDYTQNSGNWLPSTGVPYSSVESTAPEDVATVNSSKSLITLHKKCLVIGKSEAGYDGTTSFGVALIMGPSRFQSGIFSAFKEVTQIRVMNAGETIYTQIYGQVVSPQNYNGVNTLNVAIIPLEGGGRKLISRILSFFGRCRR